MDTPLYALTAVEAAAGIADRSITSEALVRSCLDRIEQREPDVGAWAYLDAKGAIAAAQAIDRSSQAGLLRGVPVGFKDVVDTATMPTGYGSMIYHGHRPTMDAVCVTQSRAAGAVILGKTVSTEFGFSSAGKTSHPQDRRYSPGGSSSGSAAAVADRMIPLAVGTQTGGSVIRPAAYCGIYGLKPSYGTLSFGGVRHLAESLDTLGCMARTLDDIALYQSALLGIAHRPVAADQPAPRLGFCRTPFWDDAQPAMRDMLETSVDRLANKGATVIDFTFAGEGKPFFAAIDTVIKFEGARLFAHDYAHHPDSISTPARTIAAEGIKIPLEVYLDARRGIDAMRTRLDADLEGIDALVTPSAPGEAPKGLSHTGPSTFNVAWTAAYTPALTMPVGTGPNGLPLGLQLVGRQYQDARLLGVARWVERALVLTR